MSKSKIGKIVKFETTDAYGFHWEKEGDFGLIAVGSSEEHPLGLAGDCEVDFTAINPEQIAICIATAMNTAYRTDPVIAERALAIFEQLKNAK